MAALYYLNPTSIGIYSYDFYDPLAYDDNTDNDLEVVKLRDAIHSCREISFKDFVAPKFTCVKCIFHPRLFELLLIFPTLP